MIIGFSKGKKPIRVVVSLYLYIEYYNKYKNYGMAQSQWTLAVHKNTKGSNHRGHKIKDFKSKETDSQGNRGRTKDLSRKRRLSRLHNRTDSSRKEFI